MDFSSLFSRFKTALVKELDFREEAKNGEETKKNFEGYDDVYIPEYYEKYCSERVLVMEYIEGVKV
jgi:ubiquinone biosynthesis protein